MLKLQLIVVNILLVLVTILLSTIVASELRKQVKILASDHALTLGKNSASDLNIEHDAARLEGPSVAIGNSVEGQTSPPASVQFGKMIQCSGDTTDTCSCVGNQACTREEFQAVLDASRGKTRRQQPITCIGMVACSTIISDKPCKNVDLRTHECLEPL